jgi:hypothetical protein
MVQDSGAKTHDGSAVAYAHYSDYIAFSKQLYFKRQAVARAKTFVHELAHYSWDTGHAYDGRIEDVVGGSASTSVNFLSVEWLMALQGADRYADFAVRVGEGT